MSNEACQHLINGTCFHSNTNALLEALTAHRNAVQVGKTTEERKDQRLALEKARENMPNRVNAMGNCSVANNCILQKRCTGYASNESL